MQLTRILSLVMISSTAATALAAGPAQTRSVSLEDCIQLALQHNLDVQIQRVNPRLAQYSLSGSYAAYDPAVNASMRKNTTSLPSGVDPQGRLFPPSDSTADSINFGLNGLLPSGLSYSINNSLSDTYGTHPGAIPDFTRPIFNFVNLTNAIDGYVFRYPQVSYDQVPSQFPFENSTAFVGINMSQPLLKNFWIDGARMSIQLNRRTLRQSVLGFQQQVMQTVTDVQVAYYALIASRESVLVQQKALELAERLLAENKKRVEVGVLAPLDEKQAESQAAASRAALLAAQNSVTISENNLKNLLIEKYTEWETVLLEPTEKLSAPVTTFSRQDSWSKGSSMRPDLLQAKLDLEKRNISLRYSRNQLFPEVDLTGSYGQYGAGKEFSDAYAGVARMDSPAYSYGISVTFPLSNRSARYNYKSSKAQVEQALLQFKKLEQSIFLQIDNAIAQAKSSLERVDATKKAREYAEAALEAEQKKLENGKSTSFIVLQLQSNLTQNSSDEIRALTDYEIALAQLALAEGSTLDRNRIRLDVK